jgi:hypothetical protein
VLTCRAYSNFLIIAQKTKCLHLSSWQMKNQRIAMGCTMVCQLVATLCFPRKERGVLLIYGSLDSVGVVVGAVCAGEVVRDVRAASACAVFHAGTGGAAPTRVFSHARVGVRGARGRQPRPPRARSLDRSAAARSGRAGTTEQSGGGDGGSLVCCASGAR